jgi:hypothetical protein
MYRAFVILGTTLSLLIAGASIFAWGALGHAVEWSLGGPCSPGLILVFLAPIPLAFTTLSIFGIRSLRLSHPNSKDQVRAAVLKLWSRWPQTSHHPTWSHIHAFHQFLLREHRSIVSAPGKEVSLSDLGYWLGAPSVGGAIGT